jgi:replicative DNA helicase
MTRQAQLQSGFTPFAAALEGALAQSFLNGGLGTGFPDLDRSLGKLQPGQLIVVGGHAQSGKTSFALSVARQVAFREKRSVATVLLEARQKETVYRILSSESGVPLRKMWASSLDAREWSRIAEARNLMSQAQLLVHEPGRTTLQTIKKQLQAAKARHAVDLVVLDNVHLLQDEGFSIGYEHDMTAPILRKLKIMARELNVVLLAVAPYLESGAPAFGSERLGFPDAIAHYADVALSLRRRSELPGGPDSVEISVAKSRSGGGGPCSLSFFPECVAFRQLQA